MIKIEIIDPSSHNPEELLKLARYLADIACPPMVENSKPVEPLPLSGDLNFEKTAEERSIFTNKVKTKIINDSPITFQVPYSPPSVEPNPAEIFGNKPPVLNNTEWNPEIHTRTKSKNADGTYKLKQNVKWSRPDENKFSPPPPPPVPAPAPTPVPAPVTPPVPAPAERIKSEPPVTVDEFNDLMELMIDLFTEKKISQRDILGFCHKHNVASIPLLSEHPHLWKPLREEITALQIEGSNP